ncbi:unnamed protein product [Caenorhabditis bovis]|uniref:Uncharacterized protein n=1 Tax=Caenorhabditis bovis TaxID=2654633 RepID=A0A8S1EYV2_9PELO|nr:unnamed protein product [Caenorhabditis bovis]
MAGDETSDNAPCTSKTFSFFDNSNTFEFVVDFEKLTIDVDAKRPQPTQMPDNKCVIFRTPIHKTGRYAPYKCPINSRWKQRPNEEQKEPEYTIEILLPVVLKGDVEPLKLCLIDRKDSVTPCSVQAARPPSPDDDVDELTEYFEHFVRVDLKMSALAESMYV